LHFNLFIVIAIALDLRVFPPPPAQDRDSRSGHRQLRLGRSVDPVWIRSALFRGEQLALEFFTGYLIEKALSVDNLFLFLVIFRAFAVDERLQHRLLEWGVVGRAGHARRNESRGGGVGRGIDRTFLMDMVRARAFLVYAGVRMLFFHKGDIHPEQSRVFRFASPASSRKHRISWRVFFCSQCGPIVRHAAVSRLARRGNYDRHAGSDSIPRSSDYEDPFIVYNIERAGYSRAPGALFPAAE